MEQNCLIGAHTSTAGGLHNALLEGQSIGATTVQFFTSNQRQWKPRELKQDMIELFLQTKEETGLKELMSHDSYLINLGAPNPEVLEKSRIAFSLELERCHKLDVTYLNFHPGAALKEDRTLCLDRIVESLIQVEDLAAKGNTRLLLEATAGQGSTVGCAFEELSYIIERVKNHVPIGVCIDTCHIFAAGYDLRTKEACQKTIQQFDDIVGLDHLFAFHLNDSMKGVGSRVDRHRPLGEGEIGKTCFEFLMTDPRVKHLPKYLETPGGCELWVKEIEWLKNIE